VLIAARNGSHLRATLTESVGDYFTPIISFLVLGTTAWVLSAVRRPVLAWSGVFASLAVIVSYMVLPKIDGERSARTFMTQALAKVPQGTDFAITSYKEQFLLYLDRPIVNFGHARWREGDRETYDAAAWLNARPGRVLMIPESSVQSCFRQTLKQDLGEQSGDRWVLVSGKADETCAGRGDATRALYYRPPVFAAS